MKGEYIIKAEGALERTVSYIHNHVDDQKSNEERKRHRIGRGKYIRRKKKRDCRN